MKKILALLATFLFVSSAYCDGMGYLIWVPIFYALFTLLIVNVLLFIIFLFIGKLKALCITTLIPLFCCSLYLVFTLFYMDYESDYTEIYKVLLFVYSILQILALKYWKKPFLKKSA